MSLTLVQLATAIEQGKTIEVAGGDNVYREAEGLECIFGFYDNFPESVRIKKEPREFWLCDGIIYKSKDAVDMAIHSSGLMCGSLALTIDSFVHVKEVL